MLILKYVLVCLFTKKKISHLSFYAKFIYIYFLCCFILGDLHPGHKNYTNALELAQALGEYRWEKSITAAISSVVDKIARDLPGTD